MSIPDTILEDAALAMPAGTLIPAFSQGGKEKPTAIRRPACAGPVLPGEWSKIIPIWELIVAEVEEVAQYPESQIV